MTDAVTIQKVDEAVYQKYSGIEIDGTPVAVFIEEPDTDRNLERVYPSISLRLVGMVPALDLMESGEDEEEVSLDITDPTKPIRTMRQKPEPYRLLYTVDTWNRPFAKDARDMLMQAMVSRTPARGYLAVENIEGNSVNAFVLAVGGVTSNDERGADEVIYHKSRSFEVFAFLDMSMPLTEHKAVAFMQYNVRGWPAKSSGPSASHDNPVPSSVLNELPSPAQTSSVGLDIRFVITDDGVQVIET